jgi:resorcinol 4-hydroxylase (FADH2)
MHLFELHCWLSRSASRLGAKCLGRIGTWAPSMRAALEGEQMNLDLRASRTRASVSELIASARNLIPQFKDRQEQTEREGVVPQESIGALLDAGLFKVLQPARHGGLECDFDDFVRIVFEVASGCGSTGWVYSVMSIQQWMAGLYGAQAQEDIWGSDARALIAGSHRPSGVAIAVDGGYRVSGMWTFCSGCDHARWMVFGVGIAKQDQTPKETGFVLIPVNEVDIDQSWNVIGLKGTGSKNAAVQDVFVPAHRMVTLADAQAGAAAGAQLSTSILYRIPIFACLAICICAPALGMATGFLDEFLDAARTRSTVGGIEKLPKRMAEFGAVQLRVADLSCAIDAAKTLVVRDCRAIMDGVAEGTLSRERRIRNKADLAYAVQLALRATDSLYRATGGHGLYATNRMQRYWRDLSGASMHISSNWDASGTNLGRTLLDLPTEGGQF